MSTTPPVFEQLEKTFASEGVEPTLIRLGEELASSNQFHELFEARKLLLRHQLGLPLSYTGTGEELDQETQNKLEDGLADICRDIGRRLFDSGRLREGWMYLRPVGDLETAKKIVTETPVDDDNLDELVELSLREGIAPAYGFSLVLDHYGTCNSITTFDAEMTQQPLEERRIAAGKLVEHLHAELLENVKNDIQTEEGNEIPQDRFSQILPERSWLFEGNRYHIDTTHLASVVRFSRVLADENQIRLAIDLTEYGSRLSSQYQYENEEPFSDLYPATRLYLQAVLGESVEEAVKYFEDKARASDAYNEGYMAIEVYIELLARAGKTDEAMQTLIELMPDASPRIGIAPTLLELANQKGDYQQFVSFCREQNDLLGFVTGMLNQPG